MIESDCCVKKVSPLAPLDVPLTLLFRFPLPLSSQFIPHRCQYHLRLKKGDNDSSSNEDSCAKRTKDHRNLRSMCVERCGVIIIYGRGKVEGTRTRKEYQSLDRLECNGSTSHVGFHSVWM